MVGTERMQHEEGAARRRIGQRFCSATPSLHGVSCGLDVLQHEPTVLFYTEAGDRIVSTIGREQKTPIRREDYATCTFKRVRRAVLTAYRLEGSGTGATGGYAFHLGNRTAR